MHAGFLRAYTANGFDEQIKSRIRRVVDAARESSNGTAKALRVLITGHR